MEKKYSEKILLVDDDTKNLQVAMSILKDYNVIYAKSGEKALELLKKNHFDLILLDVVMPGMDGYTLCQIIKEDSKLKHIPIIFLTVKDDEADIVKGFSYGAVDYVTKPFFSQVLLKRVQVHIKLANVMDELNTVNKDLTKKVAHQVKELRKKDNLINKQKKISAMGDIIDIIAEQWSQPVDKLKFYLQAMTLESEKLNKSVDLLELSIAEIEGLDAIIKNFQKFFNSQNQENINIKVSLDSTLYQFEQAFDSQNIQLQVTGDNLLFMNIVPDEIKHIFSTLIEHSLKAFQKQDDLNRHINIDISKDSSDIVIVYQDSSTCFTEDEIRSMFQKSKNNSQQNFNFAFYLMKIFIEKNGGTFEILDTEKGTNFIIKF